jgi:hypothetical protein
MAYRFWIWAVLLCACGGNEDVTPGTPPPEQQEPPLGTEIAADPQREGDAAAGYQALVNNPYVSCGLPYSVWSLAFPSTPAQMRLTDREGKNAEIPFSYTYFVTEEGVELVTANCLACHADFFNGQLVVGLGSHSSDFTGDLSMQAELAGGLISDPAEKLEWRKWADRVKALAPQIQAPIRGVNVAENITAVLIAHRDRETLAWSQEPLLPLPQGMVVPVDVPPWWRMQKKNAMFYLGQGRGDHARIMMTASTLCTDTVEEATAIDSYFPDIRAYITSIEAPAYPWPVDQALASKGATVFTQHCAKCHGTYGGEETYPNLLIALEDIGTDPLLATGSTHLAGEFVEWYHESFYGELSRIEPAEGYVAPPLDGVWATAPFLHNGSVPTIAALLESSTRPQYWRRLSLDSADYDTATLGWRFEAVDHGHATEPDATVKKTIYDTTLPGYGNAGHTFGDVLNADERGALLEYLKTL